MWKYFFRAVYVNLATLYKQFKPLPEPMISSTYIIGILGAITLILAWLASFVRTILSKQHTIDPTFTAIYFVASTLLTTYSIINDDTIFSYLNGFATILALIEFCAFFYYKNRSK